MGRKIGYYCKYKFYLLPIPYEPRDQKMNAETPALNQLRVLVVDDQMLMRTVITQNLKKIGFSEIHTAQNGEEAWREIQDCQRMRQPYDIVFLDWNMPVLDGMTVLSNCRKDKTFSRMAIVMVTAEQEKKNVLKAIEVGATSYIVKPVSFEALEKNVQRILEWLGKNGAVND